MILFKVTSLHILDSLFDIRIYFLFPLSSLFKSITACPIVPEPAKKSKTIESLFVVARTSSFISFKGLGVWKYVLSPNISAISSFADELVPKHLNVLGTFASISLILLSSKYGCLSLFNLDSFDLKQMIIYSYLIFLFSETTFLFLSKNG